MNALSSGGPQGTPANPTNEADAVLNLATLNLAFGNQQRALDLLYFAQWLAPANKDVLRKLTHLLIDLGEFNMAAAELNKLTKTSSSGTWSAGDWQLFGHLMKSSGRYDQARNAFCKAANLH